MRATMALSQEDKDYIRDLGQWFYGTPPHTVTKELGEVLARMLAAAQEKSRALNLVPRPPSSVPGIAWLVSEGVKMAWRTHKDSMYDIAVKTVALQYRSEYEMAQMGI